MKERTYPSDYPPGSHWAVTAAWQILDTLPPGTLDEVQRAYIAGLISGALVSAAKNGPLGGTDALTALPKLKQ